jgi:ribose 5-phosphate isomerase B
MIRKIGIASDHAGFEIKDHIIKCLKKKGHEILNFGTDSDERTDYPDYGHKLAQSLEKGESDIGISVCGSGNGINMTVNKYEGIRAALCWNAEIARLAKSHNNANICTLPGRFISRAESEEIINAFLETKFEGGRHEIRINKIPK